MNKTITQITTRIINRSGSQRQTYLERMTEERSTSRFRHQLAASNLAHCLASCPPSTKETLKNAEPANIAIISGYNDMLSAHHDYGDYPNQIKAAIAQKGGIAQMAGGVPAMCDGVTQGEPGMDLSLVSRDVIAMSTVIGLSHNVFDGALLLGICDKILPGLLMGGLQYGFLPMILVPGGPMSSGLANRDKAKARERFALGEIDKATMLDYECQAYHSPGTCTFYGTANSNQLMAEMLGIHLPGSSFVGAGTPLRAGLTKAAAQRVLEMVDLGDDYCPLAEIISEKAVVNAMVGLLASGGSTNETMHLVAIARAAGIIINWDDFSEISDLVPLIVRIYPNGPGDINSFQQAGGMAVFIKELLTAGLLHEDVQTVAGPGLARYTKVPELASDNNVNWTNEAGDSRDNTVISTTTAPFADTGGSKTLAGNLGRAIMKVSSLADGLATKVEAPAMVFHSQAEMEGAFKSDRMNHDLIAVVRFQGPQANGMPELHKLITFLSIIMDRGFQVGLVTDGRLSGASGKVPFAIHLTPEAQTGGPIAKVRDGDIIRMDADSGSLELLVSAEELANRPAAKAHLSSAHKGSGRSIFATLRQAMVGAEEGASAILALDD